VKTLKSKIIAVLIVLVVAAAAYAVGSGNLFAAKNVSADPILYNESTVTSIYNNASPAVVEIDVTQQNTSYFGRSLQEAQGSGFLIGFDSGNTVGYILTNNHVVEGASTVQVKLKGGNTTSAKVLGTDANDDLAVISVDASAVSGITPLTLGNSSTVTPGQMAIAIGNPYGLDNTVTVGVISGLNRSIGNLTGMLQTDASLNPGNSGGPLLDANGSVIGINTAIESTATGARGIGFAVPSDVAKNVIPNLEAGTQVQRPWIGISGTNLTSTLAKTLGVTINQGVYVVSVVSGGPAATAGIVAAGASSTAGQPGTGGDIITAVDGKAIKTISDLQTYIATKKVGDSIKLTIARGGTNTDVQVILGARPADVTSGNVPSSPDQIPQPRQMPMPRGGHGWNYYQIVPEN
jgi:S1-C subfamily serine protease